ncbi:DsbA family oxidoreductase [Terrabacter sp. NPDC000476]|jgi:predicted DsbA family dithiol-disulfide isomerase|uniref:DsbA family oxidoreductase n=1 Tax=Terrabacter sp. NPDC000476 TaxID=3154258 RepID=UPI003322B7C4
MTDQPAAESTTVIELDLWGDLTCPYSWIVKRRLEAAVHGFERPSDVTVRLRSFELDPDLAVGGGVPVREHLSVRHGGDAGAGHLMNARASELAEADDLVFDWDRAVRANTFDAHRLCALAGEMGGPALRGAATERFHAAHFGEGLALDDHEVLQRLAAECGLDERRVSSVLASDEYADQVRADEQQARSLGVTATPFVLANGYAAVTGARPTDDYLALLRGVATQSV